MRNLLSIATKFAQKNGYDAAIKEGVKEWSSFNELQVFTPCYNDGIVRYMGLPQFIIVENDTPRFLKPDEIDIVMGNKYAPSGFTQTIEDIIAA